MTSSRVLSVGTDASRESVHAADWAAREALRRRLPLRLVQAAGTERPAPRLPDVDLPDRGVLDVVALRLSYAHPALEIIARRRPEQPVAALLEAAAESETLVLGSRGFTGYSGFLVGSVALAVTARATRPVVLVRAGGLPEDEWEGPDFRPVVVGLDVTAPADELLSYAFEAAALRRAPLQALHAWTLPPMRGDRPGGARPGDAARQEERLRRSSWRRCGPGARNILRCRSRSGSCTGRRATISSRPPRGRASRWWAGRPTRPVWAAPRTRWCTM